MKLLAVWVCLMLLPGLVYSQAAGGPSFEVASIKPAGPREPGMRIYVGCSGGPGTKDPGRWTCENMTISNLISMAFELKRYQMSNQRPLPPDQFSIAAKVPEGATKEQFRQMQQHLLKDRFQLALHFEKKEVQGYEMVVAKGGVKMKDAEPPTENPEAAPVPAPGANGRLTTDKDGYPVLPNNRYSMAIMNGRARWVAPNYSMEQIAVMLGTQLNLPVIDATGVQGKYDVSLQWVTDGGARPVAAPESGALVAAEPESGPTLTTAIQDQLGLKLQSRRVTIDAVVIDRVEKVPTEN